MTTILINIIGLALIFLIVWWFWLGKKSKVVQATDEAIDIQVDGGIYVPNTIHAKLGDTLTLRFHRIDASPCSEMVVFSELGISSELPVNKPKNVIVPCEQKGEFEFTCAMGMYRGKLIIN